MATVGNLVAEVRGIESFLKSQASLGQNVKLLRNQQATNLIKKIMALKDLTYEKATEVSNLFKGSQWEKADVDRVSESIRKRLGQGAASSTSSRVVSFSSIYADIKSQAKEPSNKAKEFPHTAKVQV